MSYIDQHAEIASWIEGMGKGITEKIAAGECTPKHLDEYIRRRLWEFVVVLRFVVEAGDK